VKIEKIEDVSDYKGHYFSEEINPHYITYNLNESFIENLIN